ncbi:hypothetical protein [Paraburkholderia sp. BCC1885]|uniref:hypothetical protein n=1 Tax=Paraburkholderia sp. BCC1885 TaxID=2562669 RepID=UPI0011824468|nr:hypothetical protein [Paraburkholderia sp. BCC1885]
MGSWHRGDWFSFFQAVGSVLAILAAGAIASYQGGAARKLAREQRAERDGVAAASLFAIYDYALSISTHVQERLRAKNFPIAECANAKKILARSRDHLANFPLHELPSESHVKLAVMLEAQLSMHIPGIEEAAKQLASRGDVDSNLMDSLQSFVDLNDQIEILKRTARP